MTAMKMTILIMMTKMMMIMMIMFSSLGKCADRVISIRTGYSLIQLNTRLTSQEVFWIGNYPNFPRKTTLKGLVM